MKRERSTQSANDCTSRGRGAMSTLEVLVSLTLLMTVLKYSLPLIVRHEHLLVEQRHYRVALDELSNQLDRLAGMPPGDVPQALKILSPSPFAAAHLTAAKLSAELKPADIGQRITLSLAWNDPHEETISMAGWIFPPAGRS